MKSSYRWSILQGGVAVLSVVYSAASTKENFAACRKQPTPDAQVNCYSQIAGDLLKDIKSNKADPGDKLRYGRALLLVNEKNNHHQDDDMLRDRIRAYQAAEDIFSSIDPVGDDDWAPRYAALVDYFSRLGADYKPDVDYSRKWLRTENNVAALERGESVTPTWLSTVQAGVDAYNAGRNGSAMPVPTPAQNAPATEVENEGSRSAQGGPSGSNSEENSTTLGGSNRSGSATGSSATASGQQNGPPPPRQQNECVQVTRKRTDNNYCDGRPALIVEFRNACSTQILFKLCTQHTGGWKCASGLLAPGEASSNGMMECGQYNGNVRFWGYLSEPGVNMFNYLPPDPQ